MGSAVFKLLENRFEQGICAFNYFTEVCNTAKHMHVVAT